VSPGNLNYLYRLGEFNIKLGLSTIREMVSRLGHPQRHPRTVHIAGTNGKGSTLAILEKLLLDSGFSTGSTISPHLFAFNERFRLNGRPVENQVLDEIFLKVCDRCDLRLDQVRQRLEDGPVRPTFFEFVTAMAFCLFEAAKPDFVLLETGLGGRLDATNVVDTPLACVITRIAIDHQEFLGDSIESIAAEKLGIRKPLSPLFVSTQDTRVDSTIKKICRGHDAPCYFSPDRFHYLNIDRHETLFVFHPDIVNGGSMSIEPKVIRIRKPGLCGEHQKENIATALAVYYNTVPINRHLPDRHIVRSLESVTWSGRLEYLDPSKRVLVDGAHNESGLQSLLRYLFRYHPDDRILMAISWMKGKNVWIPLRSASARHFCFLPIQLEMARAMAATAVAEVLEQMALVTMPPCTVSDVIERWKQNRLPEHDLLVVAGSLYLTSGFMQEWQIRCR
jgi:dihydrofolate synthase / folylpolyglutamate synthase